MNNPRHMQIFDSLKLDLKIAVDGYPDLRSLSPPELCRKFQSYRGRYPGIFEAASAVYAHELYFSGFSKSPSLPEGKAAEILKKSFGSADNFFYLVRTLAGGTRVPGFLWLYMKPSRKSPDLGLARLPLCELPDLSRFVPLMCIDLWEHAYLEEFGANISEYADSYLRLLDFKEIFVKIL